VRSFIVRIGIAEEEGKREGLAKKVPSPCVC